MEIKLTKHPLAFLGPAPYKFCGVETGEDRQALNSHLRAAGKSYTTNMCGGTCDLCGQAIMNVFGFEAANGRRFMLGCDCAELGFANDPALLAKVIAARREFNRERAAERREWHRQVREAKRNSDLEARRAHDEVKRAEREAGVYVAFEGLREKIDHLIESCSGFPQSFAKDLQGRVHFGKSPTEKQLSLLARLYDEATAIDVGFYGEVKKRVDLECRVVSMTLIQGFQYDKTLYTLRTDEGHLLVCFHSGDDWLVAPKGDHDDDLGFEPYADAGDRIKIRATIKGHETYKGRSQTIIQRVKCFGATKYL